MPFMSIASPSRICTSVPNSPQKIHGQILPGNSPSNIRASPPGRGSERSLEQLTVLPSGNQPQVVSRLPKVLSLGFRSFRPSIRGSPVMPKAAKGKEKGGKKKKDPNAPKRPLAPYMFYCKEQREVVKANNPDVSFGELGKILGAQWKELDDKEKRPYMKMAEDDKKRYQDEIESLEPADDE
ncbi:unnamed protein product [Closterium sp. Yama58-4]|nr:unnamed protein product [Closterium sp. Yama58-4]